MCGIVYDLQAEVTINSVSVPRENAHDTVAAIGGNLNRWNHLKRIQYRIKVNNFNLPESLSAEMLLSNKSCSPPSLKMTYARSFAALHSITNSSRVAYKTISKRYIMENTLSTTFGGYQSYIIYICIYYMIRRRNVFISFSNLTLTAIPKHAAAACRPKWIKTALQ